MQLTDTPRTLAHANARQQAGMRPLPYTDSDFMQALERELAATEAKLAQAERRVALVAEVVAAARDTAGWWSEKYLETHPSSRPLVRALAALDAHTEAK